jgi:hypothetical protein
VEMHQLPVCCCLAHRCAAVSTLDPALPSRCRPTPTSKSPQCPPLGAVLHAPWAMLPPLQPMTQQQHRRWRASVSAWRLVHAPTWT